MTYDVGKGFPVLPAKQLQTLLDRQVHGARRMAVPVEPGRGIAARRLAGGLQGCGQVSAIAIRQASHDSPPLYVESLPGAVGCYSYTPKVSQAISLTPAQQKRFAALCKAVGVTAKFQEVA